MKLHTIFKNRFLLFSFLLIFAFAFYFSQLLYFKQSNFSILTYSSFLSIYGPGKKLQDIFEKKCRCKITWLVAEDSSNLLQLLKSGIPIDFVIGFDQISLFEARKLKWKKLSINFDIFIEDLSSFENPYFFPFNWSPIGFIYKKESLSHLNNFEDIVSMKEKISLPQPHTSTLGLQFYYWLYVYFDRDEEKLKIFFRNFKKRMYGKISSWSLAYGLFQRDRVDMSLSYLSSLIYHLKEEPERKYHFLTFKKGHPYQIEFFAVPDTCSHCDIARKFSQFLFQKEAQRIIMNYNFMFPVIRDIKKKEFFNLNLPSLISYRYLDEFLSKKKDLLKMWNNIYHEK